MTYQGINGVEIGVVVWYIDHDRIIYVPISSVCKMVADNKKSINIRTIETDGYRYYEIPVTKKKVYLSGDYSVLLSIERTEE